MVVTSPIPESNDTVHTIGDPITGQVGCSMVDTQVQHYQGPRSGGAQALLKTEATQYFANPNTLTIPGSGASAINVVPHQITVTTRDAHTSTIVNTWDSGNTEAPYGTAVPVVFGSLLQRDEYDFSSALVRSTVNHYMWQDNAAFKTSNLIALPVSSTLKDGSGCELSKTAYGYDETYNGTTLQPSLVTMQFGSAPGPVRGNRTSSSRWLISGCVEQSQITSHMIPYDTGLPYQSYDPLNHMTQYTYDPAFYGAYLTQTNMPDTQMPDPGAPIVHHVISGNYDFNTGILTSFVDENSQPYTYTYEPNLLRLTQGNHPDGGITKFLYPDPNTVERQRLITGTTYDDFKVKFDGVGRPYQTQHLTPDCASYIKVDTTYDSVGRTKTVSNPYCLTTEPTYGTTQSDYDALSRTIKTTKQDQSFTTVKYEDTPGDPSSTPLVCTTATDESGKKRQACSDAFGRLVKVIEPNPGAAATNATGSVTVNGTEQSGNSQPAVAASITVTIGGSDSLNTRTSCNFRGQCTTTHPTDTGSMSFTVVAGGVTIGPVSVPGGYNGSSNPISLAAALYSAFPSNSSVTMSNPNGTATFTLTAASTGTVGNSYTIATSMASACVPTNTDTLVVTCAGVGWSMTLSGPNLAQTTVSPQNFSGGQNASSTPDTGNVTITINGTPYTTSFGSGDTSSTIASQLATAISGGSYANASASGGAINLTSKTPGTAGDYSLAASYTWNSAQFTNPSFTTSISGAALTGAKDASALNNTPSSPPTSTTLAAICCACTRKPPTPSTPICPAPVQLRRRFRRPGGSVSLPMILFPAC
jgi:hypothetical protein